MARINGYPKTSNVSDSDVFIIDSTTGSSGTRTVLWSVIKSFFAKSTHKHVSSDITDLSEMSNSDIDNSFYI